MKKTILVMLLALATIGNSQTPTFKDELFGKTNVIHIGKNGYFEKDKFLHSTVGAWVGSSVYMYVHYKTDSKILSFVIAELTVFVIGEAKELRDRYVGGQFSNSDLLHTVFGGFTGIFTKVVQIDMQQKNKDLAEWQKEEFQNLNSVKEIAKPLLN